MSIQKPRALGAFYLNSFITLLLANMFHYSLIIISNDLIGSKAFTGILFFSIFVPILFLTPFVGRLLDNKNRRTILFVGQVITLLAYTSLFISQWLNVPNNVLPFLLMVMALIMGTSLAIVVPARMALLADIVSKEKLANATATSALFPMLGFSLAPACVGFLQNRLGSLSYFELLIIFQIVAMYLIILIPSQLNTPSNFKEEMPLKGYLAKTPLLRETLLFFCLMIFIIGPFQTLLPVLLVEELGVSTAQRGLFMSSLGIGLLFGGILSRLYIGSLIKLGRIIFIVGGLIGVLVAFIASASTASTAVVLLFITGALLGFGASALTVLIQDVTDERYRGRLTALFSLIFQLAPALGGLVMGVIAQASNTRASLMVAAFIILGTSVILYLVFTQLNGARLQQKIANG